MPPKSKRDDVARFIRAYIQREGYSPTLLEIAQGTGLSGKAHARYYVDRLVETGVLERRGTKGGPRNVWPREEA